MKPEDLLQRNGKLEQLLLKKENALFLEEHIAKLELEYSAAMEQRKREKASAGFKSEICEAQITEGFDLESLCLEVKDKVDSVLDSKGISFPKIEIKQGYSRYAKFLAHPATRITAYASSGVELAASALYFAESNIFPGLFFLACGAALFDAGKNGKKEKEDYDNTSATYGFNKIGLNSQPIALPFLIDDIAHEYTHHVQHARLGIRRFMVKGIFTEGHATSIERQVDYAYAEKDSGMKQFGLSNALTSLRKTHGWICKELSIPTKYSDYDGKRPRKYDLGNTLFYMAESIYGKDIYKDVLNIAKRKK